MWSHLKKINKHFLHGFLYSSDKINFSFLLHFLFYHIVTATFKTGYIVSQFTCRFLSVESKILGLGDQVSLSLTLLRAWFRVQWELNTCLTPWINEKAWFPIFAPIWRGARDSGRKGTPSSLFRRLSPSSLQLVWESEGWQELESWGQRWKSKTKRCKRPLQQGFSALGAC